MSYFFGKEDKDLYLQPFQSRLTPEQYKQVQFSDSYICEMYDSHRVLSELQTTFLLMLMHCRDNKGKKMVLTEADIKFLMDVSLKQIEIKK